MPHKLIDGFKKFITTPDRYGPNGEMTRLIEDGQKPEYFIISCIDSRANPGTIFSAAPGTFFAHKAMGAIVRPYKKGTALSAALAFAIDHMKVKTIVVLGHTECGAVRALVNGIEDEEISSFVNVATEAKEAAASISPECTFAETERQIVLQSVKNLSTYPVVARALKDDRVTIKPWLFDMREGALLEFDSASAQFMRI